jgi:hypothetical protein
VRRSKDRGTFGQRKDFVRDQRDCIGEDAREGMFGGETRVVELF